VSYLYHFTAIANLPGILQVGALCSKAWLEELDRWPPPTPGGTPDSHLLDRSLGNWNYVSLYYTPRTPMAYHRKRQMHLCFLVLHPRVATYEGVLFTDLNAASPRAQRVPGLQGLQAVNFEAIQSRPRPWDPDWKDFVQAEVLVPDYVDIEDVVSISFVSEASLAEAERICAKLKRPNFVVDKACFADTSDRFRTVLQFPYLETFTVTDEHIVEDGEITQEVITPKRFIKRSVKGILTCLANVHSVRGLEARVVWRSHTSRIVRSTTTTFSEEANWWHWDHLPIVDAPNGDLRVEYYLGETLWSSLDITIQP